MQSLSKPDPFGIVEIQYDASGYDDEFAIWLATTDTNTEDTFTPSWPGSPGYQNVPYSSYLRLR